MSDLSSFAELAKKAVEEKRLRQLAEVERKEKEVVPLLSELFAVVAKAKTATVEAPKIEVVVEAPPPVVVVEKAPVVAPEPTTKEPKEPEAKFMKMFNRLQSDFQTLKKYVESKSAGYGGSGGSGEVRILRMDDVVKEAPADGSVMAWDAALNKFKFVMPATGGSGGSTTNTTIYSDEEMPFAKRVDFITDNLLYKGEAVVGASESQPVWRIRKMTIGADGDVTEIWANGISTYTHTWSDRLTYTYS